MMTKTRFFSPLRSVRTYGMCVRKRDVGRGLKVKK